MQDLQKTPSDMPPNIAAMAEAFGTIVCEVVEVSQPALGSLTVHRVLCVVDCGTVINPQLVDEQVRGGVVQGIGAAL